MNQGKRVVLITGGRRSGKSRYAEERAGEAGGGGGFGAPARRRVDDGRGADGNLKRTSAAPRRSGLRAGRLSDALAQQSAPPARRKRGDEKDRRVDRYIEAARLSRILCNQRVGIGRGP